MVIALKKMVYVRAYKRERFGVTEFVREHYRTYPSRG